MLTTCSIKPLDESTVGHQRRNEVVLAEGARE